MREYISNEYAKKIVISPKDFWAFADYVSLFGNIFLICLIKLARLPPNSVTVCALVYVILTLKTLKFDKRWRNVFWRSIRKKIKISPKRSCVNVIFLTSPTPLYYLLLLTASFWTEFSEHGFTLILASVALNMHTVLYSLESSTQQIF